MAQAEIISNKARQYLHVPFHHQGRNRFGLDCIGLIWIVCNDLGFDYSSQMINYAKIPRENELLDGLKRAGFKELPELEPGAVTVFSYGKRKMPIHCGVYTGSTLIHATQQMGFVVEEGFDVRWSKRLAKVLKFPEELWLSLH